MAITVGTDTYISLADAEIYIASHYRNVDPEFKAWGDNIDTDKEILLRKATTIIDRLPLVGLKATATQVLEFPRSLYSDNAHYSVNPRFNNDNMYVQTEPPAAVKAAQCEIALELSKGTDERAEMQRAGVKSFSLGNLSETYGAVKNITSHEARTLLYPYTLGGARID